MGIIDNETIVSDLAYSVVNAELVLLEFFNQNAYDLDEKYGWKIESRL